MSASEDDEDGEGGVEVVRPEPLSKAQEELVKGIIEELEVDAKGREGALDTIRFRLRSALSLQRFYSKLLTPKLRKREMIALSGALKKVRSRLLSPEIEPFFSTMADDLAVNGGVSFDEHLRSLDQAIEILNSIAAAMVVPPGQQPRNVNKWQAKTIAITLVAEFSPRAGKDGRGGKPGELALAEGRHVRDVDLSEPGEKDVINDVASMIYAILTGEDEGVDLRESPDKYAPPTIKTRPAPASQLESESRRSKRQQALDAALAELEEMRKLTTEEHVPHSARRRAAETKKH